jgi:glyoxylase-like metal-dependent hydrolase (beta-lactamase superfamily II)
MGLYRKTFPVGALGCNCTLIADTESKEALVIDPGDDFDYIWSLIREETLDVKAIVHTHAHIDHIGATAQLAEATKAKTYLHPDDTFLHQILAEQAQMIGLPTPKSSPIDGSLSDASSFKFGEYELGVLHTPGHTPGSVCFCLENHDLCFSGDTLFSGSIGRTDLWGGDFALIEKSIKERLYTMNGAVEVIPGHGPNTHIDIERRSNPFVQL